MRNDIKITEAEVRTVIRDYLAGLLRVTPEAITGDDPLQALRGVDSVQMLRLVAEIERHWDIEFEDDEIFGSHTLNGIVALVHSRLESK